MNKAKANWLGFRLHFKHQHSRSNVRGSLYSINSTDFSERIAQCLYISQAALIASKKSDSLIASKKSDARIIKCCISQSLEDTL